MASYGFCFRPSVRKGEYPGRLYLRVVFGSSSRSVTFPYRIYEKEWDAGKRWLILPDEYNERRRQLSDYAKGMAGNLRRMGSVIREFEEEGSPYTIDDIMLCYRSAITDNDFMLFSERLANDLARQGHERTARGYRTAALRLRNFTGKQEVKMEHITLDMMTEFQAALKREGMSMNTLSFYMRTLRSIYNKALAEKRIVRQTDDPFAEAYTGVLPSYKPALTSKELAILSDLDPELGGKEGNRKLSDESLNGKTAKRRQSFTRRHRNALAMFLFCFYARGMSFADMAHLKKVDVKEGIIRYRRKKTGRVVEVEILPYMRRVLDYFAPMTANSEYLFPIIIKPNKNPDIQYQNAQTLQNQRLKKIAALAGINKNLSSNSACYSWATVAKNAGLSLAIISERLGHASRKTTKLYLDSLEESLPDRTDCPVSGDRSETGHEQ